MENPDALSLHVFPGAEGSFDLYEDDGETTAYRISGYAVTRFTLGGEAEGLRFSIEPAHGDLALIPPRRAYEIVVHAVNPPEGVTVKVNGLVVAAEVNYAENKTELTLRASLASTDRLDLTLSGSPLSYQEDPRPKAFRRLLWAMNRRHDEPGGFDLPDRFEGRQRHDADEHL